MKAIRDFSKSSSFSLSALFTGLLMLGVFFIAYFVVISSDQLFLRESEAAIELDAKGIQEIYALAGISGVSKTLENRLMASDNSSFYALRQEGAAPTLSNIGSWPQDTDNERYVGLTLFKLERFPNASEVLTKIHRFGKG